MPQHLSCAFLHLTSCIQKRLSILSHLTKTKSVTLALRLEDGDSSRRQLEHDMEERLKDAEVMGFLRIQSLSYPP